MLRLLLSLFLALSFQALAEEPAHTGGCADTLGAYTIIHNNAAPGGVTSSAIDASSATAIYVKSSGTAGTNLVYYWSEDGTTFSRGVTVLHDFWCLKKRGRYFRLLPGGDSSGTVTAYYSLGTIAVPGAGPAGTLLDPQYVRVQGPTSSDAFALVTTSGTATAYLGLTPSVARHLVFTNIGTGAGTLTFTFTNTKVAPANSALGTQVLPNTVYAVDIPPTTNCYYSNPNSMSPNARYDWRPGATTSAQP